MMAGSGRCYLLDATVKYKWANTSITTSYGTENNLLQVRTGKVSISALQHSSIIEGFYYKMLHIHWKMHAISNP